MHTAGVPASTRLRSVASSSTLPRGRRVEPKATSVDGGQRELALGAGEELDVLGVGARPAALDEVDAEDVELLGDAQLVLDRGRDALDLEAVAQGGVEDLDRWPLWRVRHCSPPLLPDRPREPKKPPGGRLLRARGRATCTTE